VKNPTDIKSACMDLLWYLAKLTRDEPQ